MAYESLLAHELPALLARPDITVLDMRDPASYARGHIEGAEPASEEKIGELMRRRRQDPPVVVYCYHGNSSRDLCGLLSGLGFSQVFNLEGGWQAWDNFQARQHVQLSEATASWARTQGFDASNLNGRIDNGMTMLMVAAMQGRRDIALELLQAGIDPNLLNDDGNNALWFACYRADLALIQLLIDHDIDLDNQNDNGATCLIYAASAGKDEVVRTLVEASADLSPTTHDGFNALDSAATLPTLRFLRSHYAAVTGLSPAISN